MNKNNYTKMEEKFFNKEVNTNSRKEMAFYIKNHFAYDRLSSWNNWEGYANNVKLYNLGLTKEQEEKAYNLFLDDEIDKTVFYEIIGYCFEYFTNTTGQEIYFNGRSDGYIVTDVEIIDYEDLKTMSKTELQEITEILQEFDAICDRIREELIYCLENATIKKEAETIVKTRKVLTF